MTAQEPTTPDTLYLDAEHFDLTAHAQLLPRARAVPAGPDFPGFPREQPGPEQER